MPRLPPFYLSVAPSPCRHPPHSPKKPGGTSFTILCDASAIADTSPTRVQKEEENMKPETLSVIRSILTSDDSVTKDKIETILRSIRQTTAQHRRLIGARQAMEILGVSRPTLRSYMKRGFITQIAFSSRKVRFDEDEIRRFADNGAPQPHSARTNQVSTTSQAVDSGNNEMDGF